MAIFSNESSNPVINKMNTMDDAFGDVETASYTSIFAKVAYFVVLIFLGVAAFVYMHSYFVKEYYTAIDEVTNQLVIFQNEVSIFYGSLIVTFICGLISAFAPKAIPVTGSIYAVGSGYTIALCAYIYATEYAGIVIQALLLTVLTIAVLAFLYTKQIVKVGSKFRTITMTALIVSVFGGLIYMLLRLIIPNSWLVTSMSSMYSGPMGIIFSILGVGLACMLILVDFDTISYTVENGLNKKYEWRCAYGLMLSIIILFQRILQLLARARRNSN